jgi:hypothetical protein
MMGPTRLGVLPFLLLLPQLLLTAVVYADDVLPPVWRGVFPDEMTYQAWEFGTPANPALPEMCDNAFGIPLADIALGAFSEGWFDTLFGFGTRQGLWDLGGEGGSMVLEIDDTPITDAHKEIWCQVTYFEDIHQAPSVSVPGGYLVPDLCLTRIPVDEVPTGGRWLLDRLVFRMEENPPHEQVIITSDPDWGSVIDQVVVDTWCMPNPAVITDVCWDQATTSVVVVFMSRIGAGYIVESAEADAYADGLTWSELTTLTAAGEETTVYDDLSANPLAQAFRFYRIRPTSGSGRSPQTAAVFELALSAIPAVKFVSTPLIPDPDHASIRDVFGEGVARQVPRNGFQVSDLNEDTGAVSRMRYNLGGTFSLIVGTEFQFEAGVGYEVVMGLGPSATYTLRLTGYVPEAPLEVPVTKTGAQALRWMAYSMPRPIGLADLGLTEAVTPWSPLNRVRLLQPGSTAWTNYQYDATGGFWYKVGDPAASVNPVIACGMGIAFIRAGPADPTDVLVLPKWYEQPPNSW